MTKTACLTFAAAALCSSVALGYENLEASEVAAIQEQLSAASTAPNYMSGLFEDLSHRQKLFQDSPPEEIKYWFEYSGELQKYFYRFSKSRGKADYFEGRDDSGVVSARFVDNVGGTKEFQDFADYSKLQSLCATMGATSKSQKCRVLLGINTIGAGRGHTMLWETKPPAINAELPRPWVSEQENAVYHLERNLEEINKICENGFAAKAQILVCEPIPALWTNWMDSLLPACGGKVAANPNELEDRPSPIQVVVVASAGTADSCHDLKSGFMEKRLQDLLFAPPYLDGSAKVDGKTTNAALFSSQDHDVYIGMKWSSLVTMRALHGFLQASADMAVAASNNDSIEGPESPFLIPSFVRVSYVSEENSKIAKWRMHGDFFHPAAWEVCKDSFDVAWIPKSLSDEKLGNTCAAKPDCGQWWVYFRELQMPTSPEVYANEASPAIVQGGSNFFWMVTDRQRREVVKGLVCRHGKKSDCPPFPQAVIPLGDLQSFLINYTPNTALGRSHVRGRRPGYSNTEEREKDRKLVKERKQLNDQDDIEKALFDYTLYPSALFHKDAVIKAARARDAAISGSTNPKGPQAIKSAYYDVSITKPRPPMLGWCQNIARRGLCVLYSDYFRSNHACAEACGYVKDWSKV